MPPQPTPHDGDPTIEESRKTLLVLDDDPHVRISVCTVADQVGWASVAAASFHEAEFLLECHPFDCIVTDVVVAREAVAEFLHTLATFGRRVPILILGGGDPVVREGAADLGQSLGLDLCYPIEKPAAVVQIAGRLRKIEARLQKGIVGCCADDCRWRLLPRAPDA